MEQETLVLIKPDGVKRNLIGPIISRFERAGLVVVGLKLIRPTEELADAHYRITEEWASSLAKKTREAFAKKGIQVQETDFQIAKRVQTWLKRFLTSGPVVAMVLRGQNAVELARKICGATEPRAAAPGTIRGDFSTDSYADADKERRALRNLVHASDSVEEAQREINVWFQRVIYY